ncbi:MAG: mechanosensitive ion channel [Bacteroidota bacterium]
MDISSFFQSLLGRFGDQVPTLVAALLILLVGSFVARLLRRGAAKLLRKTDLDNRIAASAGSSVRPERTLANIVYYLVMVFVLLMALETLGLSQILDPLKNMVNDFMGYVPNLVAAGLIGFIGYVLAKIAAGFVGMAGGTLDRISAKAGLSADIQLTTILSNLVFAFVFIPILISALDALNLAVITEPAKAMLSTFIGAVPGIFAAVLIIGLFYVGGRFLQGLLRNLLASVGVNRLAERLELTSVIGKDRPLSDLLAAAAFFFVVFLGVITGVERLGFDQLDQILATVFTLTGQIAFGLVLLTLGYYLANLAYRNVGGDTDDKFLASIARVTILGLFLAISLRTMGIAEDIVNLAFGLTLGAVAVAVALAFGLGGREAAGEKMKQLLRRFDGGDSSTNGTKTEKRKIEPATHN